MARPHALPRWTLLVLVGVAVYVGICLALFLLQRVLIYHPQPRTAPAGTPLLTLPSTAGRCSPRCASTKASALLYFGGNAEDVSASLPGWPRSFPTTPCTCSTTRATAAPGPAERGRPRRRRLGAVRPGRRRHPRVTVIGRSLGSGVAIQVASARPVERLVLVTPYDSLLEIADHRFPGIPVGWILRDKFESGRTPRR
jgi:hypothetical protein